MYCIMQHSVCDPTRLPHLERDDGGGDMSNVPLVLAKVPREFFSSKAIRGRAAPGLYALGFFDEN